MIAWKKKIKCRAEVDTLNITTFPWGCPGAGPVLHIAAQARGCPEVATTEGEH